MDEQSRGDDRHQRRPLPVDGNLVAREEGCRDYKGPTNACEIGVAAWHLIHVCEETVREEGKDDPQASDHQNRAPGAGLACRQYGERQNSPDPHKTQDAPEQDSHEWRLKREGSVIEMKVSLSGGNDQAEVNGANQGQGQHIPQLGPPTLKNYCDSA